jgi:hypothetical protein
MFHAADDAGADAFSLGNLEAASVSIADSLRSLNTPTASPSARRAARQRRQGRVFERMLGASRQSSRRHGRGALVDAQRAPLAESAMIAASAQDRRTATAHA